MTEKSKGFGWLLEQAKNLEERVNEYSILYERAVEATLDKSETAKELRKKARNMKKEPLVSVVGLQQQLSLLLEKERSLRKLLGNRPRAINFDDGRRYSTSEVDDWFENIVREFEGLSELFGDDEK